jgi:hypothetical protein
MAQAGAHGYWSHTIKGPTGAAGRPADALTTFYDPLNPAYIRKLPKLRNAVATADAQIDNLPTLQERVLELFHRRHAAYIVAYRLHQFPGVGIIHYHPLFAKRWEGCADDNKEGDSATNQTAAERAVFKKHIEADLESIRTSSDRLWQAPKASVRLDLKRLAEREAYYAKLFQPDRDERDAEQHKRITVIDGAYRLAQFWAYKLKQRMSGSHPADGCGTNPDSGLGTPCTQGCATPAPQRPAPQRRSSP